MKTYISILLIFILTTQIEIAQNVEGTIKIFYDEFSWYGGITRHELKYKDKLERVKSKKTSDVLAGDSILHNWSVWVQRYNNEQKLLENILINNRKVVEKIGSNQMNLGSISISPDANYILLRKFTKYKNPLIEIAGIKEYSLPVVENSKYREWLSIKYFLWSPDGKLLSIATINSTPDKDDPIWPNALVIIDVQNRKIVNSVSIKNRVLRSFDWSPDGKSIAILTERYNNNFKLWGLFRMVMGVPILYSDLFLDIYNVHSREYIEFPIVEDIQIDSPHLFWINK